MGTPVVEHVVHQMQFTRSALNGPPLRTVALVLGTASILSAGAALQSVWCMAVATTVMRCVALQCMDNVKDPHVKRSLLPFALQRHEFCMWSVTGAWKRYNMSPWQYQRTVKQWNHCTFLFTLLSSQPLISDNLEVHDLWISGLQLLEEILSSVFSAPRLLKWSHSCLPMHITATRIANWMRIFLLPCKQWSHFLAFCPRAILTACFKKRSGVSIFCSCLQVKCLNVTKLRERITDKTWIEYCENFQRNYLIWERVHITATVRDISFFCTLTSSIGKVLQMYLCHRKWDRHVQNFHVWYMRYVHSPLGVFVTTEKVATHCQQNITHRFVRDIYTFMSTRCHPQNSLLASVNSFSAILLGILNAVRYLRKNMVYNVRLNSHLRDYYFWICLRSFEKKCPVLGSLQTHRLALNTRTEGALS